MNLLHDFLDELFATFLEHCGTFVVVQKVHVWHRDFYSFQ